MENEYLKQVKEGDSTLNLKDIWNLGLEMIWDNKWWYAGSVILCQV